MCRFRAASIVVIAAVLLPSVARAQTDLTGSWGPRYHEDFHERIPGPELVNYLGLPINDADDRALFRAKLEGGYDWLHGVQYATKLIRSQIRKWHQSRPTTT